MKRRKSLRIEKVYSDAVSSGLSASASDTLEEFVGFGQWHLNAVSGQVTLSDKAARLLGVSASNVSNAVEACVHVVPDDLPLLLSFAAGKAVSFSNAYEFRVIDGVSGLRWISARKFPPGTVSDGHAGGILQDITHQKHAAMRERLGYELTEYLVGSHALGDAITNVIQLICRNLGWEWGAYWSMETSHPDGGHLVCKHAWHPPSYDAGAFSGASEALAMAPGQGLIGRVWESGVPEWVEDMAGDPRFLRRASARDCGLWSGYIFPVTYVSENGEQHRPGVLEFYSTLTRQPEAQLPKLSATIGALIAQTAQRKENEAIIRHLAHVDELTNLSNRSHFYAELNQRCVQASREGSDFGLMFIDLDRFKPINDAFGHEAGNFVLSEFAGRLKKLAPEGALVGRLGGDEFALLLGSHDDVALTHMVDRVQDAARKPFVFGGKALTLSASIGVSRFPENGQTSPELLRSADAAMYRVKQNGRNGSDVFSTSNRSSLALQSASLAARLTTETDLHHALKNQELFLVYQPILDTLKGRLHGVEALLRWRKPDGTLVPPDQFIPIAEQSHLIVEIGHWVTRRACEDLCHLHAAGFADLKMHVNMAASEFTNTALPEALLFLVQSLKLPPSALVLELTENMLMKQPEQVISVMHRLRLMGFNISLDDFGMGQSSLSMLRNLPITSMKVDRSFVRDLPHQERDRAIARTIIELGRQMHIDVIVEGVETQAQLDVLQDLQCDLIQGFLLAKPMVLQQLLATFPRGETRPSD